MLGPYDSQPSLKSKTGEFWISEFLSYLVMMIVELFHPIADHWWMERTYSSDLEEIRKTDLRPYIGMPLNINLYISVPVLTLFIGVPMSPKTVSTTFNYHAWFYHALRSTTCMTTWISQHSTSHPFLYMTQHSGTAFWYAECPNNVAMTLSILQRKQPSLFCFPMLPVQHCVIPATCPPGVWMIFGSDTTEPLTTKGISDASNPTLLWPSPTNTSP